VYKVLCDIVFYNCSISYLLPLESISVPDFCDVFVKMVCIFDILFMNYVQAESDQMAARARLESEFSEKLECLRETLEAGMQDKRKELEAKNAAELEELRNELDDKHKEVQFQGSFLF